MSTRRRRRHHQDPLSVVNRFVDAANRHDAAAVAACVHREFESLQPIHPVRNFKGSAQLLTNWRAIFRTEPGFRLTMLRSAVEGDTVWVELHGAGQDAEVAGIFIIGVEDGLMRWARVYSELVEPAPEPVIAEPLSAAAVAVNGEGAGAPRSLDPESEAEQAEARLSVDEEAARAGAGTGIADMEVEEEEEEAEAEAPEAETEAPEAEIEVLEVTAGVEPEPVPAPEPDGHKQTRPGGRRRWLGRSRRAME